MPAQPHRALARRQTRLGAVIESPERHQIEADFLTDDVGELLSKHFAFSDTASTLVVYEGCSMYFDEAQNLRILRSIRRRLRNPERRLWMDCVTPAVISSSTPDPNIHEFVNQMELIGEKFVYGPRDPVDFLRRCGFVCETDLTAGEFLNNPDATLGEYRFTVSRIEEIMLDEELDAKLNGDADVVVG